ncbi:HD domain protein [Vibrio phage 1.031.O._10N.261.46.F8]|nr:HD domain protein [Vibrio phage 1.031.O._10N.261.46.F8]
MDINKTMQFMNGLATTRRYSNSRLIQDENLLEHTGFVVVFSKMIGNEITSVQSGTKLDMCTLLSKAAIHDIEEVITGDIPRPTKYFSEEVRAAFEIVEKDGVNSILDDIELHRTSHEVIYNEWLHAKGGLEGSIIKLTDMAAVVYKMHSEVTLMGNLSMLHTCRNVVEYIRGAREHLEMMWADEPESLKYLMGICDQLNELAVVATSRGNGVL